ncbi:hypothetical protein QBC32DRAFT_396228 [Pseudoneurospora amorphoporcata]|uniref:Uncharacterized protein n=1 Tax=Pseudoneurospora amorphoporcata TaxID=241081 RepID=A0AAN6SI41_9PEZI|nr:hypothetical protein QBC32DRAFT_396228 [Pseudoneurospora amorphoporcata]
MERGGKPKADGVRKRRLSQRGGRKKSKTTARLASKLSADTDSAASSQANIQPASAPVLEQDTASMPVLAQNAASIPALEQEAAFEPVQGQDAALVEQVKALMKQNTDLTALLEESKRKFDVITKNAEKAKKNYISLKKANNRQYEELNAFVGHLAVKHDATRKEVSDLNAAMHFVLERGHEGSYFDKFWSKTREWKKYNF